MNPYPDEQWRSAIGEARAILGARAREQSPITYSQLAQGIRAIAFAPNDLALALLLDELSESEDEQGRGLLAALVVQADGLRPGEGFFRQAARRGRTHRDRDALWIAELGRLSRVWSAPTSPGHPRVRRQRNRGRR